MRRTGPSLPALVGLEMRKSLAHRSGTAFAAAAVLMGPVGLLLAALDAEFGWVAGPMGVVAMMTGLVMLALGVVSTAGEWTHGRCRRRSCSCRSAGGCSRRRPSAVHCWAPVPPRCRRRRRWGSSPSSAPTANTTAALTVLYLVILGVLPLVRVGKPELGDAVDPAHATMLLGQGVEETRSVLVLTGWVVAASVAGWMLTHRHPVQ